MRKVGYDQLTTLLSDYLSCAKSKISTITLIGAGIGVTVGVLAIVFGCIWLTRKNRRKMPPDIDGDDDQKESSKQKMKQSIEKGPMPARKLESISDGEDVIPVKLREDDPPVVQESQKINKATSRMITDRTDSSASETDILSKTERPSNSSKTTMHSQHYNRPSISHFSTSIRSQSSFSNTIGSRNLFPSNPSPSPRHLQLHNEQMPKRASAMSTKGLQPLPLALKRSTRSIPLRGVINSVSRPVSTVSFVQRTTGMMETHVPPVPMLSQQVPSSPTSIQYQSTATQSGSDIRRPSQVPVPVTISSNSLPSNPNATAPLNIRKSVVQTDRLPSYHDMNFRPTLQASMDPSKINDGPPRSIELSGSRAFDRPGNGPKTIQTRTKKDSVDYMGLNNGSNVSKRTSIGSNSTNLKPIPFIPPFRKKVIPEIDGRSESQKSGRAMGGRLHETGGMI